MSSGGDITLLAMAPSGETFLARDGRGRVWLYQPRGAGAPEVVPEGLVERAIADHGFDRIDRTFPTWQALDAFRQERAVRLAPSIDRDALGLEDVERLITVANRWVADGQVRRTSRLLLSLLRLPVVRADAALNERLVSMLEELEEPLPVVVRAPSTEPLKVAAYERWFRSAA